MHAFGARNTCCRIERYLHVPLPSLCNFRSQRTHSHRQAALGHTCRLIGQKTRLRTEETMRRPRQGASREDLSVRGEQRQSSPSFFSSSSISVLTFLLLSTSGTLALPIGMHPGHVASCRQTYAFHFVKPMTGISEGRYRRVVPPAHRRYLRFLRELNHSARSSNHSKHRISKAYFALPHLWFHPFLQPCPPPYPPPAVRGDR